MRGRDALPALISSSVMEASSRATPSSSSSSSSSSDSAFSAICSQQKQLESQSGPHIEGGGAVEEVEEEVRYKMRALKEEREGHRREGRGKVREVGIAGEREGAWEERWVGG